MTKTQIALLVLAALILGFLLARLLKRYNNRIAITTPTNTDTGTASTSTGTSTSTVTPRRETDRTNGCTRPYYDKNNNPYCVRGYQLTGGGAVQQMCCPIK